MGGRVSGWVGGWVGGWVDGFLSYPKILRVSQATFISSLVYPFSWNCMGGGGGVGGYDMYEREK